MAGPLYAARPGRGLEPPRETVTSTTAIRTSTRTPAPIRLRRGPNRAATRRAPEPRAPEPCASGYSSPRSPPPAGQPSSGPGGGVRVGAVNELDGRPSGGSGLGPPRGCPAGCQAARAGTRPSGHPAAGSAAETGGESGVTSRVVSPSVPVSVPAAAPDADHHGRVVAGRDCAGDRGVATASPRAAAVTASGRLVGTLLAVSQPGP
ncbi:hypothetical protein [Protofrankia coriariae]|nr:hypothetical protein [Protofrankia coriariae]